MMHIICSCTLQLQHCNLSQDATDFVGIPCLTPVMVCVPHILDPHHLLLS